MGSGGIALVLEAMELAPGDRSVGLLAVIAGLVLPCFCGVGVIAGLVWWALTRAGNTVARWSRSPAWGSAAVAALVALLPLNQLVQRLGSGRQAARYLGAPWQQVLATAVLAVGLALVVWSARRIAAALAAPTRRRRNTLRAGRSSTSGSPSAPRAT